MYRCLNIEKFHRYHFINVNSIFSKVFNEILLLYRYCIIVKNNYFMHTVVRWKPYNNIIYYLNILYNWQ